MCQIWVGVGVGVGVWYRWGFVTSKMAAVLTAKISGKCNFAKTSGYFLHWPP